MVTSGAFHPQHDITDVLQGQGGNGPPPHFGDMLTITCRTFIHHFDFRCAESGQAECLDQIGKDFVLIEVGRGGVRADGEPTTQLMIGTEPDDGRRQAARVTGLDDEAVHFMVDDLQGSGQIARDDRQAGHERFYDDAWVSVESKVAREHQNVVPP